MIVRPLFITHIKMSTSALGHECADVYALPASFPQFITYYES